MSETEHYFSASPSSDAERKQISLKLLNGEVVKIATAAGVFSASDIDEGTQVLLRKAPHPTAGSTVLDIGCGYGPLLLSYALEVPDATYIGIDTNERALQLTRENARTLGAKNITACGPGEVDKSLSFDFIYSNPPIRIGKKEMQGILKGWLMRLSPDGHAYLVVHKHLGSDSLQKWLGENGWECERISSSHGYRVLDVMKNAE